MAVKTFEVEGIGKIRVLKRRGSKSMRIKLSQDSTVTVSVPSWVPYGIAIDYAKKQREWIIKHRPIKQTLSHGHGIGKTHLLNIIECNDSKPKIKFTNNIVTIFKPSHLHLSSEDIQLLIIRGAKRALRKEAHILESKINLIAEDLGYKFESVSFKFMKSKWGSCNSSRKITLNYRLLDLPDHLIDYVLVHELVHLNHMNHSSDFWSEVLKHMPDYMDRKLELKKVKLNW